MAVNNFGNKKAVARDFLTTANFLGLHNFRIGSGLRFGFVVRDTTYRRLR